MKTYGYDIENRLTSVSGGGAVTVTLKYDPYGRLYEVAGTATTRFVYDGDAMVQELDGSNAILRRYVHSGGVDEPLVWYEGAGVSASARRHLARDRQGSIITVAESATIAPDINTYTTYGIPAVTNLGRFSYTGQMVVPEIDLLYYKARIYSPHIGRFLQTDPIGYEDQMNMYAYVKNDPMNATDPTGEFGIIGAALGAAIGGGIEAAKQIAEYGKVVDGGAIAKQAVIGGAIGAVGGAGGFALRTAAKGSAQLGVPGASAVSNGANAIAKATGSKTAGKVAEGAQKLFKDVPVESTAARVALGTQGATLSGGAGLVAENVQASKNGTTPEVTEGIAEGIAGAFVPGSEPVIDNLVDMAEDLIN